MAPMEWSPDQLQAVDVLRGAVRGGERVSSLSGWAGTGKTSLLRHLAEILIDDGWYVFWAAPTGKAALRLQTVTGQPASTLHSLLYKRVTEGRKGQPLFSERRERLLDGRRGLLMIDEGSMVGKRIYDDVLAAAGSSVQVHFAGDPEQLAPVADSLGPNLSDPTAQLTTIHRQALESPILLVATEMRQNMRLLRESIDDRYVRRRGSAEEAADWICKKLDERADAVVLTATNKIRQNINRIARKNRGFMEPIQAGDQLVVLLNNKDLGKMNGETLVVEGVSPVCGNKGEDTKIFRVFSGGEVFFVHGPSIGAEMLDFKRARGRWGFLRDPSQWLHVDYGYALTSWKAQGSEWKEVCFIIDDKLKWRASNGGSEGQDPVGMKRLLYTSITRAKEKLLILDV